MRSQLFAIVAVLLTSYSIAVYGQTSTEEQSVSEICQLSPADCLDRLETLLPHTKEQSRAWYGLKLLRFDALINLKQFDLLKQELQPWIERQDVPVVFRFTVLTYFAKINYVQKELDSGRHYMEAALDLLNKLNESFVQPVRLVQVANLQQYLRNYDQALTTLKLIEKRYQNSEDAYFKMELYANIGSTHWHLQDFNSAEIARSRSLHFANEFGNQQQISVAYINLGRTQHQLGKLQEAKQNLLKGLEYGQLARDTGNQMYCLLNLAEIAFEEKDFDLAKSWLGQITRSELASYHVQRYEDLKQSLAL